MLTVIIPKNPKQIQRLIYSLEWQIQHDINDKDKEIHRKALTELKQVLSNTGG